MGWVPNQPDFAAFRPGGMSWQKVWRNGSNELLPDASEREPGPGSEGDKRGGEITRKGTLSVPSAGSSRLGRVGAVKYNQSFLDAGYDFEQ